jgi:hypothetical protein
VLQVGPGASLGWEDAKAELRGVQSQRGTPPYSGGGGANKST